MQDVCQGTPYIRISSNPTGGFLIKFFFHIHFLGMYIFMCFLLFFCVLFVCLFVCFDVLCVFVVVFLYF